MYFLSKCPMWFFSTVRYFSLKFPMYFLLTVRYTVGYLLSQLCDIFSLNYPIYFVSTVRCIFSQLSDVFCQLCDVFFLSCLIYSLSTVRYTLLKNNEKCVVEKWPKRGHFWPRMRRQLCTNPARGHFDPAVRGYVKWPHIGVTIWPRLGSNM